VIEEALSFQEKIYFLANLEIFEELSDGELAWTSLNKVTRQIEINRAQLIKQNAFHPTEKPIKLYSWIFKNYAEPDQKILDTHLGSGSSAIAAYHFGCEFVGIEIDEDYYNASVERFKKSIASAPKIEKIEEFF